MRRQLTTQQVADALGVHSNSIREWAIKGDIPHDTNELGYRLFNLKEVIHSKEKAEEQRLQRIEAKKRKNARRPIPHGTITGYDKCKRKCDQCRKAMAQYKRKWVARNKANVAAGRVQVKVHGRSARRNWGCDCPTCKEAIRLYSKSQRRKSRALPEHETFVYKRRQAAFEAILNFIAEQENKFGDGPTHSEIARKLKMPRSTVSKYLHLLAEQGRVNLV